MFELLFKYEPDLWRRGALALSVSWWTYLALVAAAGAATVFVLGYARDPRAARLPAALRIALLAALLAILCRPLLVVSMAEPHDAHVAVLLDDSLSMRLGDEGDATRSGRLLEAFAPDTGTVARAIEARYQTHYFRMGVDTERIEHGGELGFASPGSDLGRGIERALAALGDRPLAGVVLVSDGADDGHGDLERALLAARAAGVPVSTVSLGGRRATPDVEVRSARSAARLLAGDLLDVEVAVHHAGFDGREVTLQIEHGDEVLGSEPVTLPEGGERVIHRAQVRLSRPGPARLTARVSPLDGERIGENNEQSWLVQVVEAPIRALHYEGEPRFEVKFVRRAVSDDPRIALTSLVRTAENKFYRLGIERPEDLAGGFPREPAALFGYQVLVLGSVEARAMSDEQQAMVTDFVSRRGGGLLLLGGARAFARGGYAESSMAGLLPVVLPAGTPSYRARVKVRPTAAGLTHPLTRLVARAGGSDDWARLPPLTVLNPVRAVKPGATTLLVGDDGFTEPLVLLAYHRYGEGLVAALPIGDSWRWQMHGDVALDDLTHETLWRQLVRWLGHRALARLAVREHGARAVPGRRVELEITAFDEAYRPFAGAPPTARVTTSIGDVEALDVQVPSTTPGRYLVGFTPGESGLHEVQVTLRGDDDEAIVAEAFVEVHAAGSEYHDAGSSASALRRIATATGGSFYPQAGDGIAGDLSRDPGERAIVRRLPLWDAPALFLLVMVLACAEWLLRRRRRLA